MNGTYRVLPYAVAQTLVSIPFVCVIAIMFTIAAYFLIGLQLGLLQISIFVVTLALALNVAESLVVAVSAIAPSFIFGIAMGAGAFGGFMLVCGFFLLKKNIPPWWIWLHYLSFEKYGFEVMMTNEFSGLEFDCERVR